MIFGGVIKLNSRGYGIICFLALVFLYFRFKSDLPSDEKEPVSLVNLLITSIQAAEAGGKLVVATRNDLKVESKGKTKEGLEDSVTTADFMSHCAMESIITKAFPRVNFISEETNTPCDKSKHYELSEPNLIQFPSGVVNPEHITFWIDPLDATHEYTEKLYEYVTTMVCVAVQGKPLIGVIHSPFTKTTWWAVVGQASSENLKGLTPKENSAKIKVIISRSHSGTIKQVLQKNFKDVEVLIAAGAGYKALKVADGTANAYLHITAIKKWDICAGNAIIEHLGGKMTTKSGKMLNYANDTKVINEDGLVATLSGHEMFIDKL